MRTTSAPCAIAPAAKASTSSGELRPHVVADDDAPAARPPTTRTKAAPTARGEVGVELLGHEAADVVRLDDAAQVADRAGGVGHSAEPSGAPSEGQRILRALSSTESTGRAPPPSSVHVRCSQRWQEVNETGVPSVRVIASRVTQSLPHAAHRTPSRAPGWVREPSGGVGCTRGLTRERERRAGARVGALGAAGGTGACARTRDTEVVRVGVVRAEVVRAEVVGAEVVAVWAVARGTRGSEEVGRHSVTWAGRAGPQGSRQNPP